MEKTTVGKVAADYTRRFSSYPSKTIARLLCEREPKLFTSLEQARNAVRYLRGKRGKGLRSRSDSSLHDAEESRSNSCPWQELPEPITEKTWRIVPVDFKRALIIGDIHIPYHDKESLAAALHFGKRLNVDCVILNGDVMDFYAVSFWERDPRRRTLSDELQKGQLFLEVLRERFPKARIIYKEGNHEERLWRYVWAKCPELVGIMDGRGLELVSLANVMDLDEYGIELVDNKQPIRCGEHLHVLHGHEFRAPFANPVNPARGLYLRAKCNAICGDLHQTSQHTETGLTHTQSCWSHGALCDLRPHYMPLNKWNTGFAVVTLSGGAWSVDNYKIINGLVV